MTFFYTITVTYHKYFYQNSKLMDERVNCNKLFDILKIV